MSDLTRHEPTAEAIARLFHPYVEVVLHSIEENRIVAIFNPFSGRMVGDDSLIEDVQGLASGVRVHGPFDKGSDEERRIRYVSSILEDDQGQAIGLMCINFDVTAMSAIQTSIQAFLADTTDSRDLDDLFHDDWRDRIASYVKRFLQERNQSLASLGPGERAELVRSLNADGAFRAKNAATHVASVLGVSRATVYKHLSQASDTDPEEGFSHHDYAPSE